MWLFDKRKLHNIEYVLLIIIGIICLFGIVSILTARADAATGGEEADFLEMISRFNFGKVEKQALWIAISFVVMACVAMLDYHIYSKI